MITKLANTLEMSFKVPESEKNIAHQAIERLQSVLNFLSIAKEHLDLIYSPFQKVQSLSIEIINKYKGKLNRFKQKVKENYKEVKQHSFYSLEKLNYFSIDTHCIELISSFKDSMSDLEKAVIKLLECLDDYNSNNYRDKIIIAIDNIRKESSQLEQLIRDRIINHLEENIIGKSWTTDINTEIELSEKIPTVIDIYNKINESSVPQPQKRPQILNPSDAQRVFYPQDLRNSTNIAL